MIKADLKNSALAAGATMSLLMGSMFAESKSPTPAPSYANPSARCKEGTGFNVTGSFLWWKAEQSDMPYAFVNTSNIHQDVGVLEYIDFSWKPGFRVEACWETNYDG
jgi:hypothetical protein